MDLVSRYAGCLFRLDHDPPSRLGGLRKRNDEFWLFHNLNEVQRDRLSLLANLFAESTDSDCEKVFRSSAPNQVSQFYIQVRAD